MNKPVIFSTSLVPNLLQHVLVGLGVGRFQDIVNPAYQGELDAWIQSNIKSKFSHEFQKIEGVSSSTWFALLYQIPAYLAGDSVTSLLDVLEMMRTETPLDVISRFPEKQKLVNEYIPHHAFAQYVGFSGSPSTFWSGILTDFIEAVKNGHEQSYKEMWNDIRPKLDLKKQTLRDQYFSEYDWIGWWEERTGIQFPYPHFNVELIDTTTTQGTSLLAERDGFYAYADPLKIVTVVSHEICTHLLYNRQTIENEITGPLIEEDLERYLRTVEVVSWATNREIIRRQGYSWTMEKSFDWIGKAKDDVASVIEEETTFWEIMAKGFKIMET